ncbi:patatin-like phospholipase family protein [Sulfurimonas sp.]|uniref:patatin-like phospholipase family protein n=1 Tax=Sulfurimonas sp. TaxID=2022749 RepID=UPI002B49EBBD|nr:patatin-like phospholipase family protein [Sulfurimonas sp.]
MIQKEIKNKEFCLVLSGGGALGIAQIGVLHDLEKMNLSPSEIVGTSMGAIIGACLSIGMKERKIFYLFKDFANIFNWVKLSFTGNSIISSKKIEKILDNIFFDIKMKDTKIPLKVIATNTLNGNIKVFNSTDDVKIKDALLASMAIPGIFEEKKIDNIIYSDGFLCENLGINQSSYDDILAIDVLGKNSFNKNMPNHFFKTNNVLDMFEKSMRILIYNQTKTSLSISKKNIHILEPTTKDYKTFHFHKYKEIRELGLGLL